MHNNLLISNSLKEQLKILSDNWLNILINEKTKYIWDQIIDKIELQLSKKIFIYPNTPFRSFSEIEPHQIKVIILGQDPYHNFGQANGLAFSVNNDCPRPPSLRNIIKELNKEYRYSNTSGNDLICWTKQGVLLLNSILTVEDSKPCSHANYGWQSITNNIIEHLSKINKHKVFMLWGKYAQSKKVLIKQNDYNLILTSSHPSPLSMYRLPEPFIGSNHFKKTNEWLTKNNINPIDWNIIKISSLQ